MGVCYFVIQVDGTEDQVTIQGYFMNDGVSDYSLSSMIFDDGSSWNLNDVNQLVAVPQANISPASNFSDLLSTDAALHQLIQSYSGFAEGSEESNLDKISKGNFAILPVVENYL